MDWSRRLRIALILTITVAVLLYIIGLNFRSSRRMDLVQRVIVEAMSPLVDSLNRVSGAVSEVYQEYLALRKVRHDNERLKEDNMRLQQQLTNYHEAYLENLRLRRLLDFKSTLRADTIVSRVVLHDPVGWFQTFIIDKGFKNGIEPDMAVFNDDGVVGRVLDVSDHYARVLLVTDPASSMDVLIQRNRVRGVLSGKDANVCILKYVRSNLDVQVGDLVITSGKDGVFPKGIRVGVVEGIFKDPVDLFQLVEVRPSVRLDALEEVVVLKLNMAVPDALLEQ